MSDYSTYALIDTAMMADAEAKPWAKSKRRPNWLIPLYDRPAWQVSPVVIDIEAAYRANRIDVVSSLLSHMRPQLHASLIETKLTAPELAEHLRKFIYFTAEDGSELTLRIADCVVLSWLQHVMTKGQWAAIHGPIARWRIHRRDGSITSLGAPSMDAPAALPLSFTSDQLAMLAVAHEPDQLMANLRSMRVGHKWAESPQIEIQLAGEVLQFWKESGQSDSRLLLLFARGVFDTSGRLLRFPAIREILKQTNLEYVRKDIENAVTFQMGRAR